jgi:hypothetical protein
MSTRYHATILDHLAEFISTASLFWFSLNSAYGHSKNSGKGNGGVGGGGGGGGGGEGGGEGSGSGCGKGGGGGGTARARAVFNNQLKGAAEVIMAVTVTGSGYSCDNGDHGGSDDSGCGDCDGDTNRGSGGDGNTNGCSGGDGCNDGGSVCNSERIGRDGNSNGVSCGDGDSNGSRGSGDNGIAVSVIPSLVDCCISPTTITVAADRHCDCNCPCHRPHPCHRTALALMVNIQNPY